MATNAPSVPEIASEILTKHQGIQRNAEVDAWDRQALCRPDSDGYVFWSRVAICIAEGKEFPVVTRQAYMPTPAFKANTFTIPVNG